MRRQRQRPYGVVLQGILPASRIHECMPGVTRTWSRWQSSAGSRSETQIDDHSNHSLPPRAAGPPVNHVPRHEHAASRYRNHGLGDAQTQMLCEATSQQDDNARQKHHRCSPRTAGTIPPLGRGDCQYGGKKNEYPLDRVTHEYTESG